ncbi:MAG: hypothetical protein GY701_11050, partial [Sulfitobacter sp.]|nr:hypothetical protein [Sulfitobacter sp.]
MGGGVLAAELGSTVHEHGGMAMRRTLGILAAGALVAAGLVAQPNLIGPVAAQTGAANPGVPVPDGAVSAGDAVGYVDDTLLSPSGDEVFLLRPANAAQTARIEGRDSATGSVRVVVDESAAFVPERLWAISEDGATLLVTARLPAVNSPFGQDQLFFVDAASGSTTQITPTTSDISSHGIRRATMNDDATRVVFESNHDHVAGAPNATQFAWSPGTVSAIVRTDGSFIRWAIALGDGRAMLETSLDADSVTIRDLDAGTEVDVALPEAFPTEDFRYYPDDVVASADGSVLSWARGGRAFVWDRDTNDSGVLDEPGHSQVFDASRATAAYYGQWADKPAVARDGSVVAFAATGPAEFNCTAASSQPTNIAVATSPNDFVGGVGIAAWDRDTRRVNYVAEISADGYEAPRCAGLPTIALTSDGTSFATQTNDDLSTSGLPESNRAWTAPITAMPSRDVHLTFTHAVECHQETGGVDPVLCPGGGLDGAGNDGDLYTQTWIGDAAPVETDLDNRNDFGDIEEGQFITVTGQVVDVLPAFPIFVGLWDRDDNADDPADVSSNNDQLISSITYEPSTGAWTADGEDGQAWLRGDGDTEHNTNGGHPTLLGFDISTLEPSTYHTATDGDADGDGLLDGWEINGLTVIDTNSDNPVTDTTPTTYTVIDPAWNAADPTTPDIFIENDWISDGTTVAVPVYNPRNGNTYSEIVEAFALAPTPINLWIDTGNLTDGTTYATPIGLFTPPVGDHGIDLGGGNQVTIGVAPLDHIDQICDVHSGDFYDIKDEHFDSNRRWAFRYALNGTASIFAGADLETRDDGSTYRTCHRGGQAEIGGNDILTLRSDAVVMMHELGHSLNLRHGGDSNTHCKPNYVSVMNYVYDRGRGLPQDDGRFVLDYSPARYASGTRSALMASLDESNLSELVPFDASNTEHRIRYSDGEGNTDTRRADANPDYSGDRDDPPFEAGTTSVNRQEDLVSSCDDGSESEVLTDHDDWAAATIPFRNGGDYDDAGLETPDEIGYVELDEDIDAGIAVANRADIALEATIESADAGTADVLASVHSVDTTSVVGPSVSIELSTGVTLASTPPE